MERCPVCRRFWHNLAAHLWAAHGERVVLVLPAPAARLGRKATGVRA